MEYILLIALLLSDGSKHYMSFESGDKQQCSQLVFEVVDTFSQCNHIKNWAGTCKVQGWNES